MKENIEREKREKEERGGKEGEVGRMCDRGVQHEPTPQNEGGGT